ncbi:MAG: hypothetical protein KJO43_10360 [Phycisphaerae bacterium]|nr:hypothetical protein [Phycisphaerae bacterium]NNF42350.1 hypothetical protein [Phycisphaerales bacterium]
MPTPTTLRRLRPIHVAIPAVLVALGVVPVAAGQNALGTGNALDRNLDPRYGGVNPAAPIERFRDRNLIITRAVTAGREFRGVVGYGSPGEFAGEVGSDTLRRFRRDSAWSSVNFLNYGNTYEQLRFGQDVGLLEYPRVGRDVQARFEGQEIYQAPQLIEARLRLDRISAASTTRSHEMLAVEPSMVGAFVDEEGNPHFVHASSLSGVGSTPVSQLSQLMGLSTLDKARVYEDVRANRTVEVSTLGDAFQANYVDLAGRLDQLRTPEDESTGAVNPRIDGRVGPSVVGREPVRTLEAIQAEVATRFAERTTGDQTADDPEAQMRELEEDLARLRARLAGRDPDAPSPDGETTDPESTDFDPIRPPTTPDRPGAEQTLPTPPTSLEEFGVILRHGKQISQLASGDETRFDELLGMGEESLRDGDYFWAERRFNRALRFVPGHPMATAGLAHAQIGAGLNLSAALTLRSLFTYQPEMIDVEYTPELVPSRPRLIRAIETITPRLEIERDRATNAFLYAYIGRLLDDAAAVRQGLSVMEMAAPDDPLLPLLKRIWQPEPAAPGK